jgi:hypothetical protein
MTRRKPHRPATHYSMLNVLMASPTAPMPESMRLHQLTAMYQGLAALEQGQQPTTDDWRVCSDAVNLMETLILQGHVSDADGLLMDAITALAKAGRRNLAGAQIRLDGPGIAAVRAVLEDYASVLDTLPERVMVQCHRDTERRLRDIMAGKRLPHDVEIVSI